MKNKIKGFVYTGAMFAPDPVVKAILSVRHYIHRSVIAESRDYVNNWMKNQSEVAQKTTSGWRRFISRPGLRLTDKRLVIAMVGLPQTGKTTVAKEIAGTIGALVVSNNEWRHYRFSQGSNYDGVNEIEFSMMQVALAGGYNVVMDSDYANPAKRRCLEVLAKKYEAEVLYVYVSCDEKILKGRLSQANHDFGTLYFDAIEHLMPDAYFGMSPDEYEHLLMTECVLRDYERQVPEHTRKEGNVLYSDKLHRTFTTNCSLGVLKSSAMLHGLILLEEYGLDENVVNEAKERKEAFTRYL